MATQTGSTYISKTVTDIVKIPIKSHIKVLGINDYTKLPRILHNKVSEALYLLTNLLLTGMTLGNSKPKHF